MDARAVLDRLAAQGVTRAALCADSRTLRPGEVFVACPGVRVDARALIPEALARGAAAVLWERAGWQWDTRLAVPNVGVEGLQGLAGDIAHLGYGRPSEKLDLVGVTGTNGKTSVSQWIAQALSALGRPCAVIGTLGAGYPGRLEAGANTTPDAVFLHRRLAGFVAEGARACAMEVSSIGLDQGRVAGAHFHTAVFTNLTRDHLEYHGTMDAYGAAKAKLFAWPGLRHAVINLDDAFGRELARIAGARGIHCIGYSQRGAAGEVDLLLDAREVNMTADGLRLHLALPGGRVELAAPLVGRFNVDNVLAVLGALLAFDLPAADAVAAIARLVPPPGRMERYGGDGVPLVVVDYAHTPDALAQALAALRDTAHARGGALACVFGCGGERDPGKRPQMGEVAARLADRVVITSDNPRSEDPLAIIEQVAAGAGPGVQRIEHRAEAIAAALAACAAADVLLIAGKGHEDYQEIAGRRLPYSDAEQARAALAAWREQHA